MDTQTILTLAVVVNVAIALVVVAGPRLSRRRDPAAASTSAGSALAVPRSAHPTNPRSDVVTAGAEAIRDRASLEAVGGPFADWMTATNGHHLDMPSGIGWAGIEPLKDAATGFDLSAAWARWMGEEEARVRRFHRSATVVVVELVGIDRLAERLGPETAERLIPPIAVTMRRHGREVDHFARLGSSRFGVLLTETGEVAAINYVERIRAACDLWLASGAVSLRLAVGWAEINQGQTAAAAVQEAEQRLFADRERPRGKSMARARREPSVAAATVSAS